MQVADLNISFGVKSLADALEDLQLPIIRAAPDVKQALLQHGFKARGQQIYLIRAELLLEAAHELGTEGLVEQFSGLCSSDPGGEVNNALVHSRVPEGVHFPNTLPPCAMHRATLAQPYSLCAQNMPPTVKGDIQAYTTWCMSSINIGRGTLYAMPVQQSTMECNIECIKGFLGFLSLRKNVTITAGLILYWNPILVAHFIAFLMARGVGRGQIMKHLSVSKKINQFYRSSSTMQCEIDHSIKLEEWLATLERQASLVTNTPIKDSSRYDVSKIRQWIHHLKKEATEAIQLGKSTRGETYISHETAKLVSVRDNCVG